MYTYRVSYPVLGVNCEHILAESPETAFGLVLSLPEYSDLQQPSLGDLHAVLIEVKLEDNVWMEVDYNYEEALSNLFKFRFDIHKELDFM